MRKVKLYDKVIAASRALGSKQIYVPAVNYYSPPLSAVVIVVGLVAFFACEFSLYPSIYVATSLTLCEALTFAVHPYQWPNMAMGHSPPIATRSGWISIAILPFLMFVCDHSLCVRGCMLMSILRSQGFRYESQLNRDGHWDLA